MVFRRHSEGEVSFLSLETQWPCRKGFSGRMGMDLHCSAGWILSRASSGVRTSMALLDSDMTKPGFRGRAL